MLFYTKSIYEVGKFCKMERLVWAAIPDICLHPFNEPRRPKNSSINLLFLNLQIYKGKHGVLGFWGFGVLSILIIIIMIIYFIKIYLFCFIHFYVLKLSVFSSKIQTKVLNSSFFM